MPKVPRSAEQIMILILRTTLTPTLSTHMMYDLNLNSQPMHRMCTFLEERGLLEKTETPTMHSHSRATRRDKRVKFLYRATEKGTQLLKDFDSSDIGELYDYGTWNRRRREQ